MKEKLLYIGCDYYGESGLRSFINSDLIHKFELVGVLTYTFHSGKNSVVNLARILKIPIFEGDSRSDECQKWLEELNPSVGLMMEYPKILPHRFINQFKWILNAHPSDLPDLRGGAPLEGLILQQKPLRISVHQVDAKFDHGPIIHKSDRFDISGMHFYQVYELAAHIAPKILMEAVKMKLKKVINNNCEKLPLPSCLWYKEVENLLKLDWKKSDIHYIHRQVLAAGPKRGASTMFLGDKTYPVRILKARALSYNHYDELGLGILVGDGCIQVSGKGGYLIIDELKEENNSKINFKLQNGIFV